MHKAVFRVLWLSFMFMFSGYASALSHEDVLGKMFINSAGSCCGSFLMSVSIEVKGRNTAEVGFLLSEIAWSDVNISAIGDPKKPLDVTFVMVNCKSKTYSLQETPGDAYTHRQYLAGTQYKWGDYSSEKLISKVKDSEIKLTEYFKRVCDFTGG